MPVGFGFSAGDFISGVLLVKDIIKALDNVSGSSAEYDALRGELRGLERALHLVSNLPPGTCSTIQHTTETCVQACHNIIQAFVRKAAKFDTTLIHAASTSQQNITRPPPWKAALRKVQWALLKKEDVVRVRLEIAAQVAILNTLLNHKQLLASENQDTALTQLHNQMSQQHGRLQQIEALLQVQKQLSEEGKGDLESFNQKLASIQHEMSSTKTIVVLVWRLGRVLFQLMVQLQKWLANPLPAQVLLQRVAILEDALGRTAPLHIEWLNSWEVFHSSLEARFKDHPGWTSVKRKDYLFFDQITDLPVDLSKPWATVLRPDRKLAMCIVLPRHAWSTTGGACPRCGSGAERRSSTRQIYGSRHYRQAIKHYECACGLNFCQMRLQDYMASTGRTVGRSESVHRQSSRLNSQATGKSRRQKRGKVKLRRIKSVQCDLQDLRRVFVFELEPIENRSIYASAQHQNHESIHPTQIPSDGHARLTGEADSTTILDLEPIPSVADTRPAVLTTEPEETSIYIEADDSSDAASIITLEGSCFTELTGVHRLGAEFEHGRRYHGHHAGLYFQPDDERAQERMDLGHHMYVHLMDRKLYFAPIGNEDQRVLDVGTGTGLWAIDFADEHPHSWVEGVDLSAVQPQWVPPNVHFYIDDASTLDLYGDDMDFIHARGLNGCFDKWDEFYESVLKTLEPGGWFEQVEHSIEISSQERSPPPVDDPIPKLQDILSDASKITGRRFDVHADLHESLERAGFTEVCSHVIHCPIGPWARDKNLKDCGCYALEYWSEFLEDMFLALMTRFLEWDAQEARAFLATVRKQFLVPKRYLYFNIVVAYGRRPP